MKYNTVIFDLDGTLLNTLEDLMDATNYALGKYGYPPRTLTEIRNFVGNGAKKLIERSLPSGPADPHFDEILSAFREYYNVHCQNKTCAYDGILKLMKELKAAGFQLAIVSNKPDSAVKSLSAFYFSKYISAAAGEKEQEGIRKKPAPDMVESTLAELGSSKDTAVYVGDSDVDIQTAANCGLPCISVTWGFRDMEFLEQHGATVIAHTPEQLFQLLTK